MQLFRQKVFLHITITQVLFVTPIIFAPLYLEPLAQLEDLTLERNDLFGPGFDAIGKLSKLKELSVWSSKITDDELKTIGKLKNLTDLNVGDNRLSDEGMAHLAGLKKLERLYLTGLGGCTLSDAGVAHLAGLTNLKVLTLGGQFNEGRIGDAGLAYLGGLPELEHLDLGSRRPAIAPVLHEPRVRVQGALHGQGWGRRGITPQQREREVGAGIGKGRDGRRREVLAPQGLLAAIARPGLSLRRLVRACLRRSHLLLPRAPGLWPRGWGARSTAQPRH